MVKTFDLTVRVIIDDDSKSGQIISLYEDVFNKLDETFKKNNGFYISASVYGNESRPIMKRVWNE